MDGKRENPYALSAGWERSVDIWSCPRLVTFLTSNYKYAALNNTIPGPLIDLVRFTHYKISYSIIILNMSPSGYIKIYVATVLSRQDSLSSRGYLWTPASVF